MNACVRPVSASAAGASGALYSGDLPVPGAGAAAAAGISGDFGAQTFCIVVSAVGCVARAITPPVPLEFSGGDLMTGLWGPHPPLGGNGLPRLVRPLRSRSRRTAAQARGGARPAWR